MVVTSPEKTAALQPAGYVGGQVCASCHAGAWNAWQDSQHAKAMQHANESTVLGDFDDATFRYAGIESTFFRRDGGYFVRTDGPDGTLGEFEIQYTFGLSPLQQYLIPMPGGRLQALSIAWDSRSKSEGGQRWFHLYPHENVTHDDVLHWTRPGQNWNNMCADCHSTNLEKGYDPVNRSYSTTWSEINVSCEACHGPASRHVAWATKAEGGERYARDYGLLIRLDEREGIGWKTDPATGQPVRSEARASEREIAMCAHCHSRRSQIAEGYVPGQPLLDHYLPSLLHEGLYFPDGQIDDEVYVYGSFLQSRMHAAGVTCSDCHEPHGMRLRASGNTLCLQCHAPEPYDRPAHHHHPMDSAGASCVECHMPTRTYMVVDPRRDHSLRIPRPDLTERLGTPNACNNCHRDRTPAWAAARVAEWYGDPEPGFQRYAGAFHAARQGVPQAGPALAALIEEASAPDIVRASALSEFGPYLDASTLGLLQLGLADANPRVRAAGLAALEHAPLDVRVRLVFPLLEDPVLAVRLEAARLLAVIPAGELPADRQAVLDGAIGEYRESLSVNADWPESQIDLGRILAAQGRVEEATEAFTTANEINPWFVPGYVNLADLYRQLHRDDQAEQVLRQAIQRVPDTAALHHALGLTLVRRQQMAAALESLGRAAELEPANARYTYVYAVALHSSGEVEQGIEVLEEALPRFPYDRDVLAALVAFHRDRGDAGQARRYADELQRLGRY